MLKINQKAPNFQLLDQTKKLVNLHDLLKDNNVVLYFYPKDNTPGCTIQAQAFSKMKEEFEKKNCIILGVSKDNIKSHENFTKKKDLKITLLSDENLEAQKKYGVWQEKNNYGKKYMGTVRTTFLIEKNGIIKGVWEKVRVKNHVETVLEKAKELWEK